MSNDLPKQTNLFKKLIPNSTKCKRNKTTSCARENLITLDCSKILQRFLLNPKGEPCSN